MEKYKSAFFGPEGLTSTSANHIANVAKEYYESFEKELNATSFIQEEISIVGTSERTVSKLGTPDLLPKVDSYIKEIYSAKSLIAWLREAIKRKKELSDELNFYRSDEYNELLAPSRPSTVCEQDIIEEMTIGERERYLSLETKCAVYGKYIHPGGAFDKAKDNMYDKISNPVEAKGNGRDTIITYFTPLHTKEEIKAKLFTMQNEHRSAQAELNSIKSDIEKKVKERNDIISRDYMAALDAFNTKKLELAEKDKQYVIEERKKIESLKIVIPERLRPIYEKIKAL